MTTNLFKLQRLIKTIEDLEFQFKYCTTVGDFKQRLYIEDRLGLCYRALMREVRDSGLERIYLVGDMYEIFMKTG